MGSECRTRCEALVLKGLSLALIIVSASLAHAAKPSAQLDLGPNVLVFNPSMPAAQIQGQIDRIYATQQHSEFGTARFALLPTPNPSGNFTKITQRVPVKIDIVDPPKPLTPGMMVEVEIDIR